MSATLTEYMVQKADEFNARVDVVEQKISIIYEKIGAMEYNVNRLVHQLEVLVDTLPYIKPNSGETGYEKYLRKE